MSERVVGKIHGIWTAVTSVFLVASLLVVATSFTTSLGILDADRRALTKELLQIYLHQNEARIAEEIYLGLDTVPHRESDLRRIAKDKARVSLRLIPPDAMGDAAASGDDVFPIHFGDRHVGTLRLEVEWLGAVSSSAVRNAVGGGATILAVLLTLLLACMKWTKRRMVAPLVADLVEIQRKAAIASTVQMIAHDARKPLSLVKMLLGRLDSVSTVDEARRLSASFRGSADRAMGTVNRLIDDVLEYSGNVSLEFTQGAASTVFAAALEQTDLGGRADIEVSIKGGETPLDADFHQLGRVVANLVGNAVQAMKQGGRLTLSSRRVEGSSDVIEITVHNTGSYIDSSDVEKVFEPFFTKGKKGGTGLGLAICQRIVEAHGGTIVCRSDATSGVAFTLRIPAVRREKPEQTPTSSASRWQTTSKAAFLERVSIAK